MFSETLDVLALIQRLAATTDGPWIPVTDFGAEPDAVTTDSEPRPVASALNV
jgi:hypothetical protein